MKKKFLTLSFVLLVAVSVNSQSKSEVISRAKQDAESGISLMNSYSTGLDLVFFGYYDSAYRTRKGELSSSSSSSKKPSSISAVKDKVGIVNSDKHTTGKGSIKDLLNHIKEVLK